MGAWLALFALTALLVCAALASQAAHAQAPAVLTISASDVRVTEGHRDSVRMVFTVTLSGSPTHDVAVAVRVKNGTATPLRGVERDFVAFAMTLTFAANASGDALIKKIPVKVVGDRRVEPDETVILELYNLVTDDARVAFIGGGERIEATGTIVNDDSDDNITLPISVVGASVAEGDQGLTNLPFTVTLSDTPTSRVRVQVTALLVNGGTATGESGAERDFTPFQDELFFEEGASGAALAHTVNVQVLGDHRVEPDETVILRVNNLRTEDDRVIFAGNGKRIEVAGTITNDDAPRAASLPAKPGHFSALAGNGEVALSWDDPNDETITVWQVRHTSSASDWTEAPWTSIPSSDKDTTTHTVRRLRRWLLPHYREGVRRLRRLRLPRRRGIVCRPCRRRLLRRWEGVRQLRRRRLPRRWEGVRQLRRRRLPRHWEGVRRLRRWLLPRHREAVRRRRRLLRRWEGVR